MDVTFYDINKCDFGDFAESLVIIVDYEPHRFNNL